MYPHFEKVCVSVRPLYDLSCCARLFCSQFENRFDCLNAHNSHLLYESHAGVQCFASQTIMRWPMSGASFTAVDVRAGVDYVVASKFYFSRYHIESLSITTSDCHNRPRCVSLLIFPNMHATWLRGDGDNP